MVQVYSYVVASRPLRSAYIKFLLKLSYEWSHDTQLYEV